MNGFLICGASAHAGIYAVRDMLPGKNNGLSLNVLTILHHQDLLLEHWAGSASSIFQAR